MKSIEYQIQFYSQWHCVPGKTLKGLIREASEDYATFCGDERLNTEIISTFGTESTMDSDTVCGSAHFSNATFSHTEYSAIVAERLQKYLYQKVTTTAIGKDGVALDHSLRSMEVVVPCMLHGEITNVPEAVAEAIVTSLGLIKRLGQKRNRGYGRCDITLERKEAKE